MRSNTFLLTALAAGSATAYPGMGKGLKNEISGHGGYGGPSRSLLGDLAYLPDHKLTAVGKDAKCTLQGTHPATGPAYSAPYHAPGPLGSKACAKDTCCVWKYIANELIAVFTAPDGQCTDEARSSVRLGFHDAGPWHAGLSYGGADGSILLNPKELARIENKGLEDITPQMLGWYNKYKGYGVSAADLMQFASILATVVCPLGPQVKFLVGRPDSSRMPPPNLMPLPSQDAPYLIQLFQSKTLSPSDLVALVGAHTVSEQDFVDPSKAGEPQDTTEGIWDVKFYNETLQSKAPDGVFRFHSDISLSQHPTTKGVWHTFASSNGQLPWDVAYAQAYFRLSLLGVKNINNMHDCTKVLPPAKKTFKSNSH